MKKRHGNTASDARIIKGHRQSIIDELQLQFRMQGRFVFPPFLQQSSVGLDGKGRDEMIWEVKTTTWESESDCHQTAVEPRRCWQVIFICWTSLAVGWKRGGFIHIFRMNEGAFPHLSNWYVWCASFLLLLHPFLFPLPHFAQFRCTCAHFSHWGGGVNMRGGQQFCAGGPSSGGSGCGGVWRVWIRRLCAEEGTLALCCFCHSPSYVVVGILFFLPFSPTSSSGLVHPDAHLFLPLLRPWCVHARAWRMKLFCRVTAHNAVDNDDFKAFNLYFSLCWPETNCTCQLCCYSGGTWINCSAWASCRCTIVSASSSNCRLPLLCLFSGGGAWKRRGENIWVSFLWILYTPTCGIRGAVALFSPAKSQSSASVELLCLINLLFAHHPEQNGVPVHLYLFIFSLF